jgi:hypothetical protein
MTIRGQLGSKATDHKAATFAYLNLHAASMRDAKRAVESKKCLSALDELLDAAQYLQGYKVHGQGYKRGAKNRASVAVSFEKGLKRLADRFAHVCVTQKW